MTMQRKLIRAQVSTLGEREVEVVMSTDALARDGHVLIPAGCDLENYRANPIVLWSHDPEHPIGNVTIASVGPDQISARVMFAPAGISRKADEICGLVKADVIRAVSVGFDPVEMEPLDPKKPRGGQRIMAWELLELSFVSVPADTGAVVTARAFGDSTMTTPTEPVARSVATATLGARASGKLLSRGLYAVAQLAYLFEELDWHVDMAKYEASIEQDSSKVPGMLANILHDLGDALIAMTQEEIAEALAGHDVEPEETDDDIILSGDERAHIRAAASPRVRAFRRGYAISKLRAGKTLSDDTVRCLREAVAMHEEGIAQCRAAIGTHKKGVAEINNLIDRAGVSDPDDDTTQTIQTSDGTDVSEGAENGRSFEFRQRQAALIALAAV